MRRAAATVSRLGRRSRAARQPRERAADVGPGGRFVTGRSAERAEERADGARRTPAGRTGRAGATEDVEEAQAEQTSDVQERVGKLTDDVDALLDEIDDVLEEMQKTLS